MVWPGFNARYAMPIAPSLAVLAGMGWDWLAKSNYFLFRRIAGTMLLRVDRLPARSGGRDYAGVLRSLWRIAE
jgi:hypothetical protein